MVCRTTQVGTLGQGLKEKRAAAVRAGRAALQATIAKPFRAVEALELGPVQGVAAAQRREQAERPDVPEPYLLERGRDPFP